MTTLWSQDAPFTVGERLVYSAGFRLFDAGTTTMEVAAWDTTDLDTMIHIISVTKTTPFFDRFFRIRDRVEIWLNYQSLELRSMRRDIHEGRYHRQDTITVDRAAGLIYARRDTHAVSGPVFDPIGAIYYLRGLSLEVGDEVQLTIFDGRHLRPVTITAAGRRTMRVPAGEFECLLLEPVPLDDRRLTKVDGILRLWLATDDRRTPVRVEQRTSFGTMILRLREIRRPINNTR